jgi:hypothetical protein
MRLDLEAVAENIRRAETEDLLDRLTVYSAEMEPEVLPMIAEELVSRGVRAETVAEHHRLRAKTVLVLPGGIPARCTYCQRPAVFQQLDWHRLWGQCPLFRRRFFYCDQHDPRPRLADSAKSAVATVEH